MIKYRKQSCISPLKRVFVVALIVFIPFQALSENVDDIYDPIEGFNRAIFTFNNGLDDYFLQPVARGYRWILPTPVRTGVNNFLLNLNFPQYVISDLMQFKLGRAAEHTGRFLVNSTVGILGIFDVAQHIGLQENYQDFGMALAYNGVPPGPYLQIPILGPYNLRDGFGDIVDTLAHPVGYIAFISDVPHDVKVVVGIAYPIYDAVHRRSYLIEAVDSAKSASVDYYAFVRAAYMQHRASLVAENGGAFGRDTSSSSISDSDFDDGDFDDEGFDDQEFEDEKGLGGIESDENFNLKNNTDVEAN